MENDEILKNVIKALQPHTKFIFTTLNGLFPLYNSADKFCASATNEGNALCHGNSFDLITFRNHNVF